MFNIIFKIERWKWNECAKYWISTEGRVKDASRQLIKPVVNSGGYLHTPQGSVHRLVMETWKPISNADTMTIDHINHNKRDNSLANLEWVSEKENLRRAHADYDQSITSSRALINNTAVFYPDTHILTKRNARAKEIIKMTHRVYEEHRLAYVASCNTDKERSKKWTYQQIKTDTFDHTKPLVMRSSASGTVRYFSNFKELVEVLGRQPQYLPQAIRKGMSKGELPLEEMLARIAEGTLMRGLPVVSGVSIFYGPKI